MLLEIRTGVRRCFRPLIVGVALLAAIPIFAATESSGPAFPRPLDSYGEPASDSLWTILSGRVHADPFNLVATIIFLLAITHTFLAPVFTRIAHRLAHEHEASLAANPLSERKDSVSFRAQMFHFLGEVEAIFGIWVIPLLLSLSLAKSWPTARDYLGYGLVFTEPLFVVVVMTIAASRPVLKLAEQLMALAASLGGSNPAAWWFSILTVGPLLGSFITEPAAMTISALLLAKRFYELKPSATFAYATLGLLFVNVSVGGTLTHFAAPPVLMVAGKWGWGMSHMLTHFGWKALIGILVSNVIYALYFRRQFAALAKITPAERTAEPALPLWITAAHLLFLAWTVFNNHYPALFIGGFLFYLAFVQATEHHQEAVQLRPALLVGFFLAGLVVHGGLQGWWIAPVLSRLSETPLFLGAMVLTAFNDNAAITYLASLVPSFSEGMKYAVVAGAVAGGGLTVIANAPNPAGQSILSRFFPDGISPLKLLLGALLPTAIVGACFLLFR
jgi:hypothetical protein